MPVCMKCNRDLPTAEFEGQADRVFQCRCGRTECNGCSGGCQECGARVCDYCLSKCDACGYQACPTHETEKCYSCPNGRLLRCA